VDALTLAILKRAAAGHRIHLIVSGGIDASIITARLRQAAMDAGFTTAVIATEQSEQLRRAGYRADITIVELLQILRDRTRDLLQWPLKPGAAHHQFDQLYGRRSSSRSRLLPDGVSTFVYPADHLLLDHLAANVTVDEALGGSRSVSAGAVHALSLFRSYHWLAGVASPGGRALKEISSIYQIPVTGSRALPEPMQLVPRMEDQATMIVQWIADAAGSPVFVELLDDALATQVCRCLQLLDIAFTIESDEGISVMNAGSRVRIFREWQPFTAALSDANPALVIITGADQSSAALRRLRDSVDPLNHHEWRRVCHIGEPRVAALLPRWLRRGSRFFWRFGYAALLTRLFVLLLEREERQQRQAFVTGFDLRRRRFAFTPHWGQSHDVEKS